MSPEIITIHNIPEIIDVNKLIVLLGKLGVKIKKLSKGSYSFQADEINLDYLETEIGPTVETKLEEAKVSLDSLQDNFIDQIADNNTLMLLAFDALQTIVVNLKTDMLSNFNIAVDYTDADGD